MNSAMAAALAAAVAMVSFLAAAEQTAGTPAATSGQATPTAVEDGHPAPDTPRDVTTATRLDSLLRSRLEAPGQVLFEDDFERVGTAPSAATPAESRPAPSSTDTPVAAAATGANPLARYFEVRGARSGLARIVTDRGLAHGGQGTLQLTSHAAGGGAGAGVSAWLPAAQQTLHLRYYLKYAEDYDAGPRNHTGGSLAGIAGVNRWLGMGAAGRRPRGDDYFLASLETGMRGAAAQPGGSQVYAYWPGMRADGRGNFWGNILAPTPRRAAQPGRWTSHELMVRANTPGVADGELAVWIDGSLYLHVVDIRWRDSPAVLLRRFSLDIYVHDARRENRVWYDDVIVSTGYVGP